MTIMLLIDISESGNLALINNLKELAFGYLANKLSLYKE